MSLDLETLALIAAAVNRERRASLDANDFHPQRRILIDALKDGKKPENRECVRKWLASLGVNWDGKGDIGTAIIESLSTEKRRRRAMTALSAAQMKLRNPALAGPNGVAEATKLAETIQGIVSGIVQPVNNRGERDS